MKLGLISLLALGFTAVARSQTNPPSPNLVPSTVLAWDADLKQYDATTNDPSASFVFWVTNVSLADVAILSVSTSCGCTVAQLPSQPWILLPGGNGPIRVTVDLRGRYGAVMKGVTVNSSQGIKALVVRANVLEPPASFPVHMDKNFPKAPTGVKPSAAAQPKNTSPSGSRVLPVVPPQRKW